MDGAYFSPRAIKANEEAVRKSFAARPDDDAENLSKSRMGQRIGSAVVRAQLDEINRGTPVEIYVPAFLSIIAWMMANTVAALPTPEERAGQLGRYFAIVEIEAVTLAIGNNIVTPDDDAHGEAVGGHA